MVAERPHGADRDVLEVDDARRGGYGCGGAGMREVRAKREAEVYHQFIEGNSVQGLFYYLVLSWGGTGGGEHTCVDTAASWELPRVLSV